DDCDRESQNVEDRRSQRGGGGMFPGGGGGFRIPVGGRGGFSITTLIIIGVIMLMFGINPLDMLGGGGVDMSRVPQLPQMDQGQPRGTQQSPFDIPGLPGGQTQNQASNGQDELGRFTRRVLADTEDVWKQVFEAAGRRYKEPTLVMFRGATRTACGQGISQMGPFYCPLDQKIYVDLAFYEELKRRFHAPGDFAQAYVIAHEVGHHVQTLLGIADKVNELKQAYPREANQIQVRMELQADCFAGVWANLNHQLKNRLESGDIEEGLNAASRIGDDMIQRQTQGYVVPESFTHGSSQQRVAWFKTGFQAGKLSACDTFRAKEL
ncbi:MAG: neutral zinc metallopeptidase, partial [Hyphomicrobiaceae bacterium]